MKKRLRFVSENWARRIMALWLLPLVWMSLAASAPHDHDLRALSALSSPASTCAHVAAIAPADDCLLCEWASVGVAWLLVVLALQVLAGGSALFAPRAWQAVASSERLPNSRAPPTSESFAPTHTHRFRFSL